MHKVLSKGALNFKVYKTASYAETHHWINMTCDKVAINGPNLKKLAPKNQIGERKVLAQTLTPIELLHFFVVF